MVSLSPTLANFCTNGAFLHQHFNPPLLPKPFTEVLFAASVSIPFGFLVHFCTKLEILHMCDKSVFVAKCAGGSVEIAKTIYVLRDKIKFGKLSGYALKFDSHAVVKRLGCLLEILEIGREIIDQLRKIKAFLYVVPDTSLPKTGKRISRWSIQQNLDAEIIKFAIYT